MLNRDPANWPPFPGPDAPEAVRLRWAVERFLPPGARTAPAPTPASSSPPEPAEAPAARTPLPAPDRPEPVELARVLGLPLDQFDRVLRVAVPWLDVSLWFVPDEMDAEALVAAGEATRGAVWTRRELLDLLAVPGITRAGARTVALAKLAVAGEVVEVWATAPLPCQVCKGRSWWRSVHGRTVCAACHPPAAPGLVAEWWAPAP